MSATAVSRGSRRRAALVALPVTALLLAGCTGDGDASATPSSPTVVAPPVASGEPSAATTPRPEVSIGESAALSEGVRVVVGDPAQVQLKARGPGEVRGPGARVTVKVSNRSGEAVDLGALTVNAYYGAKKTPAPVSSYRIGQQLSGSLDAGEAKTGTYYFRLPAKGIGTIKVEVSSGDSPYVLTFANG